MDTLSTTPSDKLIQRLKNDSPLTLEEIQELVAEGADVNYNFRGWPVLNYLVSRKRSEDELELAKITTFLISKGVDNHYVSETGSSVLSRAAMFHGKEVIMALCDHTTNIYDLDISMFQSILNNNAEGTATILELGASISSLAFKKFSTEALDFAVESSPQTLTPLIDSIITAIFIKGGGPEKIRNIISSAKSLSEIESPLYKHLSELESLTEDNILKRQYCDEKLISIIKKHNVAHLPTNIAIEKITRLGFVMTKDHLDALSPEIINSFMPVRLLQLNTKQELQEFYTNYLENSTIGDKLSPKTKLFLDVIFDRINDSSTKPNAKELELYHLKRSLSENEHFKHDIQSQHIALWEEIKNPTVNLNSSHLSYFSEIKPSIGDNVEYDTLLTEIQKDELWKLTRREVGEISQTDERTPSPTPNRPSLSKTGIIKKVGC
ncbi:MAG: hypothetical protein ISQ34_01220 [Rickettsiales bacterium]|nr:hypothetical protein [Rickettsiales bacterium]